MHPGVVQGYACGRYLWVFGWTSVAVVCCHLISVRTLPCLSPQQESIHSLLDRLYLLDTVLKQAARFAAAVQIRWHSLALDPQIPFH